ncbi:MAG: nucleotide exchange factor GrpE [Bacteroidaceae bacterium]|nr:nucleotide exchange factor GrpE [Bacteroidaceae bacterium]
MKKNNEDIKKSQDIEIEDNNEQNEACCDSKNTEESDNEQDSLEAQLAKAQAEIAELKDKNLRQIAEFDNYRKRVLKEKADLILNGGEKILTNILPIIDDLERAQQGMTQMTDVNAVKEGVNLIIDKFMKFLKSEGVAQIETEGKDFDVNFHEAITMIPAPSDEMKGKVIDCVSKGYTLNDKVIRYAKVVVGE